MGFSDPIVAGEVLIRTAIRSANYQTGVSGWRIAQNGFAEFTGLIIVAGGAIALSGANASVVIFNVRVAGDAQPRFQIQADGRVRWGDGTNPTDTSLVRTGAAALHTDNEFNVARTNVGDTALSTQITTDPVARLTVRADGEHQWGDGQGAADVILKRSAPGILSTGGTFNSFRGAVGNDAYTANVTGDAVPRWAVDADGRIEWGDGTTTRDTNLHRLFANHLTTDGELDVGTDFQIGGRSQGRGVLNFTVLGTNVTGVTTETTVIDTGAINWPDGRAYAIEVELYGLSSVAGDQIQIRIRRNTNVGTTWHDYFAAIYCSNAGGTNNRPFYAKKIVVRSAGATLSNTGVVVTGTRFSGTGTLAFNQSSSNQPYVCVTDIGAAADYPNAMAIT
jgi:hypothetical protein